MSAGMWQRLYEDAQKRYTVTQFNRGWVCTAETVDTAFPWQATVIKSTPDIAIEAAGLALERLINSVGEYE